MVDPQTTFTPEALSTAFQKYRTELIVMPMYAMAQALQHMGYRDGIRYKEHVHEMKGNFQMGNFDKYKKGDGAIEIVQRTLETFLGNCIEPIDPISIYKSLWGSDVTKGEALKTVPWVKRVCAYIMAQLGEQMFKVMWTAKHDPTNTTLTSKWFNGFCTIEDDEIAAGKMAMEEGNLYYLPETFTPENAEDLLKDFYWGIAGGWNGVNDKLRNQKLKLFMHVKTKHFYEEAYQHNHGALPYNEQYIKAHLDGVPNVEFVPLTNVPENYLCLTPKNNILALWNQRTADETFLVKESKTSHYDVDFLANMFYGEQYLSINKEMLCVARNKGSYAEGGKVYNFTSYGSDNAQLATGVVKTAGVMDVFNGVKYNLVEVTQNSVDGFVGNKYYVVATATANGSTKYDLYDLDGKATGMKVTIAQPE